MEGHVATVRLVEGMHFRGETKSGHRVEMDAAPEVGGEDKGARPAELLMVALGGCTGMDVISILRKMRQDVTSLEVNVSGIKAEEHPKVFTEATIEYIIRGRGISEEHVRKAIDLSSEKYCVVQNTMNKVTAIKTVYRIEEV